MIEEVKNLISHYSASLSVPLQNRANSAVIVPIFEQNGHLGITFIKRSENTGLHRGQMGFPGGMAEPSDRGDLVRTALRESQEEIGILPEEVDIVGSLETQSTIKTGILVQPFVGVIPWPYGFSLDPVEVQSIHTADLRMMTAGVLGDGNRFGLLPPVYPVDDQPVWGLTARIVAELVKVLMPVLGER